MSHRSSMPDAGEVGAPKRRSGLCAWAFVMLAMVCAGAPASVRADTIVLTTGELIEGAIVDATRNTVIVRRAIGGMRQMSIKDLAEIRILVQGQAVAGELLGWTDGVYQVRSGDEILRISAGHILTRERQAITPSAHTVPAQSPPQPPRAPWPAKSSTAEAAAPAAPAPEVAAAEVEHVEAKSTQAASAEVAAATGGAPAGTAAEVAEAENRPAAAASTVVRPTPIAAAPAVIGPVTDDDAGVGTAAAEVNAAAIAPAAVVALSKAAAAEIDTGKTGAAQVRPAADPAAVAAVSPAEVSAAEVTAAREAKSDDRRPAVRGSVDRAGVDGIVFRFELSRPADQTVVLIYGTVDGTATAGKDYEPQQGVVTLTPGSKSADVRVPVIEHRRHRDARFELFLTADPKVAKVVDQRISATIPAAD